MTQDGIPVIEGASEEENASDDVENHKMFTADDMMKTLLEQKRELEASFAKEKTSGSGS